MKPITTLATLATATLAATTTLCASAADTPHSALRTPHSGASRPNIVFILADDLGWADLGCLGSKYYETPNLDRLAAQGMRFTSAYVMPNCAPTRACLWSGKYSPRTGIYTVSSSNRGESRDRKLTAPENNTTLALDIPVLPEILRGSGYLTALFGKWHLGRDGSHGPAERGFDSVVRYDGGGHFNFTTKPEVKYPKGQYLTDFLADRGIEFMRRARKENKSFFLALAHFAVHGPWQAPEDAVNRFKNKPPAGGHKDPVYAAMIFKLDQSVGRVLDEIDRLGIAGNTIVIFSSDNGGLVQDGGKRYVTDNSPLRGGKGMHYEGGIRVPYIVRWPGVAKPGATCDTPIHAIDFVPTICEMTRHAPPPGAVLDGRSFVPLLEGRPDKALAGRTLYWHCPSYLEGDGQILLWRSTPGGMIRQGTWKLIELFEDNSIQLYNLATDLSETTDLSKKEPQIAADLLAAMHKWRAEMNAPMPVPNPDYHKAFAKKEKGKGKRGGKNKGGGKGGGKKTTQSPEDDEE